MNMLNKLVLSNVSNTQYLLFIAKQKRELTITAVVFSAFLL